MNVPLQGYDGQASFSIIGLPESFHIGVAVGAGDCFFDSIAQCLNEGHLRDQTVSVKSLRQLCKRFAERSLEDGISPTLKLVTDTEDDTLEDYISEIELTSADVTTGSKGARWGRPEIEGRIICMHYRVKIHVVERHKDDTNDMWYHEIVSENGPRSTTRIDYADDSLLHIINRGDLHFDPILRHRQQITSSHLQHLGDKFKLESQQVDEGMKRLNVFRAPEEQATVLSSSNNNDKNQQRQMDMLLKSLSLFHKNVKPNWNDDDPTQNEFQSLIAFYDDCLTNDTNLVISACKYNQLTVLDDILSMDFYHTEPTEMDNDGFTALYFAISANNLEMVKKLLLKWPKWPFEDGVQPESDGETNILDVVIEKLNLQRSSMSPEMTSFLQDELEFRRFLNDVRNFIHVAEEMENGVISIQYCYKMIEVLIRIVTSLLQYDEYLSMRSTTTQVCHYRLRLLVFWNIGKTLEILFQYCPNETLLTENVKNLNAIVSHLIIPLLQFHRVIFLQEQTAAVRRQLAINRKVVEEDIKVQNISHEMANWFVKQKMYITHQSIVLDRLSVELMQFRERLIDVGDIVYRHFERHEEPFPEFLIDIKLLNAAYRIFRYVDVTTSIERNQPLMFQNAIFESIGWAVEEFLKYASVNLNEQHRNLQKYVADIESRRFAIRTVSDLHLLKKEIEKICSGLWLSWSALTGDFEQSLVDNVVAMNNSDIVMKDIVDSFLIIEDDVSDFIEKAMTSISSASVRVENDMTEACLMHLSITAVSEIHHFESIPTDVRKKVGDHWIPQNDDEKPVPCNGNIFQEKAQNFMKEVCQQALVKLPDNDFRDALTLLRAMMIDDEGKLLSPDVLLQRCQWHEKFGTLVELLVLQLENILKKQTSSDTLWHLNRLMNRSVELIFPRKSNVVAKIWRDPWRGLLLTHLQMKATTSSALLWTMEFEGLIAMKDIFDIHGGRRYLLNALYSANDDSAAWRKMKTHYSKLMDVIATKSRYWTDVRWRKVLIDVLQYEHVDRLIDSNDHYELTCAMIEQELFDASCVGDLELIEFFSERALRLNSTSPKRDTVLHLAIRERHIDVVNSLLHFSEVDINATDKDGNTPLLLAAFLGHTDVAEILIKNNANVNASNEGGLTALHIASWRGDIALVNKLLFSGADIELTTLNGFTALFFAIGRAPVVKELLERKANVNARSKTNSTPLHEATRPGNTKSLKLLLQNRANIHVLDNGYGTPLHLAVLRGDHSAVVALLEHGSEVNVLCSSGLTIVHHAAQRGHWEILMCLLARGGVANDTAAHGLAPIHLAAQNGHLQSINVLMEYGANVNAETDDGWTAYDFAAIKGSRDFLEALLFFGAVPGPGDKDAKRWMPGIVSDPKDCAVDGDISPPKNNADLRSLLDSVVDTSATLKERLHHKVSTASSQTSSEISESVISTLSSTCQSWSALHYLVMEDMYEEAVKYLDDGAKVNVMGPQNLTPLHLACQIGHSQMVDLLIERGADLNAVSEVSNQNALHFAVQRGHLSVTRQLLIAGAHINAMDANGNSCLHQAVLNDNITVVTMLLDSHADIEIKNREQRTPLHLAVTKDSLRITKLLVGRQADVSALDSNGCTPLLLAVQNGYSSVGVVLLTAPNSRHAVNLKNVDHWAPLHLAVLLDDVHLLKHMIEKGGDVNILGKDGYRPLHVSSSAGLVHVARFLLKNKAEVNLTDDNLQTPLHLAAKMGDVLTLKCLLENGADVNVYDADDFTPLFLAIQRGDMGVIQELLEKGAHVESYCTKYAATPLFAAIASRRLQVVQMLILKGARVNAHIEGRISPLRYAAYLGDVRLVNTLIERGAYVNAGDAQSNTPLHVAARDGHQEVVQSLVKAGAYVNVLNDRNRTPLQEAVENGHTTIVSTLLENGAALDRRPVREYSLLHFACRSGDSHLVELLISRGADINSSANVDVVTPLHIACQAALVDVVTVLLKCGAATDARNAKMATALHIAAELGTSDVVRLLLDGGASVGPKDDNNSTPLHAACKKRDNKVVLTLLLTRGADVNCVDKNCWTPLHYAAREGDAEMVEVLLDNGADVTAITWNGTVPLHIAARRGHLDAVRQLLRYESNCNAKTLDGLTPLYAAAANGHVQVVDALLQRGADVNEVKSNSFWTALHIAAFEGHLDVVNVLLSNGAIVDSQLNDESTPLCLAAQEGHADVVSVLLKHDASIQPYTTRCSLLHTAVRSNDGNTLKHILTKMSEKKSEFVKYLEAKDRVGNTAVMRAANLGMLVSAETLLQHGADVNATNFTGMTGLHLAAQQGHSEMIELLMRYEVTVLDAVDRNQNTALHLSTLNKHVNVVSCLIRHEASLSMENAQGQTPLHLAAEQGGDEIVIVLLNAGAQVNWTEQSNYTPLHLAAMNGHCSTAEILLKGGALIDSELQQGITPLYLAAESGQVSMVRFLLKNGGGKAKQRSSCPSILHACVCSGNAALLRLVLMTLNQDRSVDLEIDAADGCEDTPLMWACEGGFLEAAKILFSFGSNANVRNKENMTSLHWAAKQGHVDIVQLLLRHGVDRHCKDIRDCTALDLARREMNLNSGSGNFKNYLQILHLLED